MAKWSSPSQCDTLLSDQESRAFSDFLNQIANDDGCLSIPRLFNRCSNSASFSYSTRKSRSHTFPNSSHSADAPLAIYIKESSSYPHPPSRSRSPHCILPQKQQLKGGTQPNQSISPIIVPRGEQQNEKILSNHSPISPCVSPKEEPDKGNSAQLSSPISLYTPSKKKDDSPQQYSTQHRRSTSTGISTTELPENQSSPTSPGFPNDFKGKERRTSRKKAKDSELVPGILPRKQSHTRNQKGPADDGQLTAEEKKANHIASEQKRRHNIRVGFERLVQLVPTLNQKQRSEAVILQRSLEHLHELIDTKNNLKTRKRELKLALDGLSEKERVLITDESVSCIKRERRSYNGEDIGRWKEYQSDDSS